MHEIINSVRLCDLVKICFEAGAAILHVYNSSFDIEHKEDKSPITLADKNANDLIVYQLSELYPSIPILSEEGKNIPYQERHQWKLFWLVDPLDGTKEFIKRNGEFTVNIALIEKDEPIVGVVYAPVDNVWFYAANGTGAYKYSIAAGGSLPENDTDLVAASQRLPILGQKKVYTVIGSRSHMSQETTAYIDALRDKYGEVEIRSSGSSLKLCCVAEGAADEYPRFAPTMEWDTAAGHVVAQESGALVINTETGTPLTYNKENLVNPWFIARRDT